MSVQPKADTIRELIHKINYLNSINNISPIFREITGLLDKLSEEFSNLLKDNIIIDKQALLDNIYVTQRPDEVVKENIKYTATFKVISELLINETYFKVVGYDPELIIDNLKHKLIHFLEEMVPRDEHN